MPKRTDLRSVLIVGSGPIRIGQGCEFDYAGVQACRALRGEGYRVVLVNSNPATIMTDPEWADATYLEPLDALTLAEIVAREAPDALLPTLGGQTALNLAVELAENGVLAEHGVELIGADVNAIRTAEDRLLFRTAMESAGLPVPLSVVVTSLERLDGCPVPAVVRPAFTLGGRGGGIARTPAELRERVAHGLAASPIGQVLVEQSLEGWQEFELEVVVDVEGNCIVVCSIENLDPVGVHTGDSWTVAPQQTLPDGELQRLRNAAFACARAVGVATGGANVQFAYEPETRELALIEMNPRVSRSSALASKATGYPIAKLAALLAVGYTLDELPNDITGESSAAFEPALDYVAVKAPRFDFEKFPGNTSVLGTEMRAVGEALGLGRTFPEALLKALEGVEAGDALPEIPGLHPYFTAELESIRTAEHDLAERWRRRARRSVSGSPMRASPGSSASRSRRCAAAAACPGRLAVDSCAGEFEARTPYYYLSHETSDGEETATGAIVLLGSGTNRIGQGIEFDYCCVRAAQAFRRLGHEVVLVNSNPETVSTDYDTCDRLYLEPVTLEHVLDVVELERPLGVVLSLGGQTPLGLAAGLAAAGVPLLGDPLAAIDTAEDRGRFGALLAELGLRAPAWGHVDTTDEARELADAPRLSRPRAAVLRARRPRHARRTDTGRARALDPCARRPLPRRARSSSTSTSSATARTRGSRRSSSTSSGRASTRATRPACCRLPRSARPSRRRSGRSRPPSPAVSAPGDCSTSSSLCTKASCMCSRRTRGPRGPSPSLPRRPGPARRPRLPSAPRRLARRARACRSESSWTARGRRRRSSRRSGSRAPPTGVSRCARPAR